MELSNTFTLLQNFEIYALSYWTLHFPWLHTCWMQRTIQGHFQRSLSFLDRALGTCMGLLGLVKHTDCCSASHKDGWQTWLEERWLRAEIIFFVNYLPWLSAGMSGRGRKIEGLNGFTANDIHETRFEFLNHSPLTTFPSLIRLLCPADAEIQ